MSRTQFLHGGIFRLWADRQATAGGVATFHPTDDDSGAGNALFQQIDSVQATAESNTSAGVGTPTASQKLVSADKKTITVNVITGTTLGVLGATALSAPDGTMVALLIVGY